MGGSIEEATKVDDALGKVFPAMFAAMLIVIILQVRSMSTMFMVILTGPLGLSGVVPILLILLFLPALYVAWFRIKPIPGEELCPLDHAASGPAGFAAAAE